METTVKSVNSETSALNNVVESAINSANSTRQMEIKTIKYIETPERTSYLVNGKQFINAPQLDQTMKTSGLDPKFFALLKGSVITLKEKQCKAGDSWANEKTGETGQYTKDHIRVENLELELGIIALSNLSFASSKE